MVPAKAKKRAYAKIVFFVLLFEWKCSTRVPILTASAFLVRKQSEAYNKLKFNMNKTL